MSRTLLRIGELMTKKMQEWLEFLKKVSEMGASQVRIDGDDTIEVSFGNQGGMQVIPQTTLPTDEQALSDLLTGTRTPKELLEEGDITPRQKLELEMSMQERYDHDHYRSA